jgi:hypothetical protein
VRDLERTLAGAVHRHRGEAVTRLLDGRDDVVAPLAADARRVAVAARQRVLARTDESIRIGPGLDELGQHRLTHRPPLEAAVERALDLLQVGDDRHPIGVGRQGLVQPAQPFEAGLEGGLGPVVRCVPGFEVIEQSADLDQRVNGWGREVDPRGRSRIARDQRRCVKLEDVVGFRRAPQRRVGQQLDPQVGHGVAQGAADARRVVVLLNVASEITERLAPPLRSIRPQGEIRGVRRLDDLLEVPGLEIELAGGLHPLALVDLPRVDAGVGGEGVGVVKVEHRVRHRIVRPRLVLEKTHRGLVAVERHSQLGLLDQGAGPILSVALGRRACADGRHRLRSGFELLFRYQPIDVVPGHGPSRGDGNRPRDRLRIAPGGRGRHRLQRRGRNHDRGKDGEEDDLA